MKTKLRTAPQILEHYLQKAGILDCVPDCEVEAILKAMRHYARVKREKDINISINEVKEKLREEVKDEMYEEARENILLQYNLK